MQTLVSQHVHVASGHVPGAARRALHLLPHARRKAAAGPTTEGAQPEPAPAVSSEPEFVPSSGSRRRGVERARRGSSRSQRARGTTPQPPNLLKQMQVTKEDAQGFTYVDMGCVGRGRPQWYAIAVLEGKESKFMELLQIRLLDSLPQLRVAPPGSWAPTPPEAPPQQQAAAAAVLARNDVVLWLPQKTMMVYRANIDRLVERPVMFGDGGWVLVHAAMTNALHEVLTTCPYFMEWRFSFGVTAQLLQEAGMWPAGSEGPEGWKLPTPVPEEYWGRLTTWALDTSEAEDLEEKRREIYGPGGGSPFGEVDRRDLEEENIDYDEFGNKIYRNKAFRGGHNNPSRWHEGGDAASSRQGSGGRGRGRGRAQQQQQYVEEPVVSSSRSSMDEEGEGDAWGPAGSTGRGSFGRGAQQQGWDSMKRDFSNTQWDSWTPGSASGRPARGGGAPHQDTFAGDSWEDNSWGAREDPPTFSSSRGGRGGGRGRRDRDDWQPRAAGRGRGGRGAGQPQQRQRDTQWSSFSSDQWESASQQQQSGDRWNDFGTDEWDMGSQQQQQQQWGAAPADDFGGNEWDAPRQQQQRRGNRSERSGSSSKYSDFDERQQAWQSDMGSARYNSSLDNGEQPFAEAPGTSDTRGTSASDPFDAWVSGDMPPATSSSRPPPPAQQQQQPAALQEVRQEEPGDMLSSWEQGDDGTPLVRSTRSGRRRR